MYKIKVHAPQILELIAFQGEALVNGLTFKSFDNGAAVSEETLSEGDPRLEPFHQAEGFELVTSDSLEHVSDFGHRPLEVILTDIGSQSGEQPAERTPNGLIVPKGAAAILEPKPDAPLTGLARLSNAALRDLAKANGVQFTARKIQDIITDLEALGVTVPLEPATPPTA